MNLRSKAQKSKIIGEAVICAWATCAEGCYTACRVGCAVGCTGGCTGSCTYACAETCSTGPGMASLI